MMAVLLVAMLVVPAYAASGASFTITPSVSEAVCGDEIVFTVSVSGTEGATSLGYIPEFDKTAYELVGTKRLMAKDIDGDDEDDLYVNIDKTTGGIAIMLVNDALSIPEGKVGSFTLKVIADTAVTSNVTAQVSAKAGSAVVDSSVNTPVVDLNKGEEIPEEPVHVHTVEHVEAKEATCLELGNIEYWYCTECGDAWLDEACGLNTNLLAVKLPTLEHTIEHVEAVTADCFTEGNIEYWYCTTCGYAWQDEALTVVTNLMSVKLPMSEHSITHVEAKAADCWVEGNIEYWFCENCGYAWLDEACTLNTNLKAVVTPAAHELTHVEAVEATCEATGNIEYWYCAACESFFLDEYAKLNTNSKSVILPVSHNITHVEAKAADCFEEGNIEYWFCEDCGYAWLDEYLQLNTNLKAVILPMTEHAVEHVEAVAATCDTEGNLEYWYCTNCGYAWLDEACTLNTNLKAVVLPALEHNITHVEAVAATCEATGNIEYWYCENCGYAWLDEACTLNTNLKAVVLPVTHSIEHVAAVAATCETEGNIEYWYCTDCGYAWLDEYLHLNTNLMSVILPATGHSLNADGECTICGNGSEIEGECAHTVEHVAAVAATCDATGNIEYWYCTTCGYAWLDEACTLNTNLKAVILPVTHDIIHVEAVAADCYQEGNIEYWYCADCGYAWLDEYLHLNTNLMSVVLPMTEHSITHVEAVEATCDADGNIEYWFCENCGYAWLDEACTLNTNLKSVILPATQHTVEHVEAVAATCFEQGNIEYWYCTTCGYAWLDADCTLNTNLKAVILPVSHNVKHVEAVAPICDEDGNVEYWYCEDCGYAWLDEYLHLNTNLKAVVLPAVGHTVEHVAAVAATCTKNGNIEYWYCTDCGYAWLNAECNLNTNLKSVITPATGHTFNDDGICKVCGGSEAQTGDSAMIITWIAVMALSAAAFVVMVSKKRHA